MYAALSLTVILSLYLAILEGVRLHTIQLEAQVITDIAAESVLAEYHRELFERYGMFFVDTSYKTKNPSTENLAQRLEWYIRKNCNVEDVFLGDYLYRDFLGLCLEDVMIVRTAVASDEGGRILRERAVEVVKDEIGLAFLEQVMQWLETVEQYGLLESDLEQEKEQIDSTIEQLNEQKRQVGEDWVTIEVNNPTAPIEEVKRKGILRWVLEEPEKVSNKSIHTEQLISHRRMQEEVNQGNWKQPEKEELTNRLLWQEYLMRYCGFFGQELEGSALQYQLEYLIVGKENDMDNLRGSINRIMGIREAANLLYLYSDGAKNAEAEAAAALIAAAIMLPEIQPVFKTAILLGWAYAESLYDVRSLLEGKKVPLIKTAETWQCDMGLITEGMLEDGLSLEDDSEENFQALGLSYADYLRLLLILSPLEEQTFRMMDIMEMDIRQTPANRYFRMDGCVDRLMAEVVIKSSYGYVVEICKENKY